jgi:trehalose synthase
MYGTLALSHRALDDLGDAAGAGAIEELRALARPIEGLRVLNLSVTGFGTGTAELLNSSVPLLSDLGLDCYWQVVRSSEDSAHVTRAMYQALGGTYVPWTQEMTDTWMRYAEMNADLLTEDFDVVVIHDPQPAALHSFVEKAQRSKWIMHSHLDLSSAQDDVWLLLRSHIEKYDAMIVEADAFAPATLSLPRHVVPPAIDPNSPRNMALPEEVLRTVLERYGIDPELPLVSQVTPCDVASDLSGAVDAVMKARERFPKLQAAFILMTAPADSPSRACYDELARRSAEEPGIFVLSHGNDIGNVEINVFQRSADVVIQKGLRKGFGMWMSDALWKERPCVVAPHAGLTEQVIDGETGLVRDTTDGFADAIVTLLENRELARKYGEAGRRHVAKHFLITRYLRDYLRILNTLHQGS